MFTLELQATSEWKERVPAGSDDFLCKLWSVEHPTEGSRAKAVQWADLDRDAFFNAEFVIGHRGNALLKSQVLHSVSAAAHILRQKFK